MLHPLHNSKLLVGISKMVDGYGKGGSSLVFFHSRSLSIVNVENREKEKTIKKGEKNNDRKRGV